MKVQEEKPALFCQPHKFSLVNPISSGYSFREAISASNPEALMRP